MANLVLFILALVALLVIFESIRMGWRLSISRRMTLSILRFERINQAAPLRMLLIGDSTGYGTGTSDSRFSITGRLASDFPQAHIENWSKTGISLGGVVRILKAAPEQKRKFDVLIIMAGGIDVVYHTPLKKVRLRLKEVLERAKHRGIKVIVVMPNNPGLAPLYHFPLSALQLRRAQLAKKIFVDVAREEKIAYVSLYRESADVLSERNLYAQDKTHPNDEGYRLWYEQIREAVHQAVTQLPASISRGKVTVC